MNIDSEPLYLANPAGLAHLIECDNFQGPNFYQRARIGVALALAGGRVLKWGVANSSVYGAVLFYSHDGAAPVQVTKGKVRWADLAFYGFRRQP